MRKERGRKKVEETERRGKSSKLLPENLRDDTGGRIEVGKIVATERRGKRRNCYRKQENI